MNDESQKEELSLFEKHSLNCYNFQEILLYWIRTSGLDHLQLGTSDISRKEMIEMCKIQNLIQCKERGKIMSELSEAESSHYYDYNEGGSDDDNEDSDSGSSKKKKEKDTVPFNNKEQAQHDLEERFKRLALNEKDYYLQQKGNNNNIFDLFIFKSLILSLGMNEYFDCDMKDLWGVDSRYLLPSEMIDQWLGNTGCSTSRWEFSDTKKENRKLNKMIGLSIEDSLGWERFITNTRFIPPEDEKEEERNQRKEKINEKL